MFDSEYFRTLLQADVDAAGGGAIVELHLLNGRSHRVRSVLSVHAGYVTFETYQARSDASVQQPPTWKEETPSGESPHPTRRAVVAYESIANVEITSARPDGGPKIGFARS